MPSPMIIPFAEIPAEPVMGKEEVCRAIPQRFEMLQLDGILLFDLNRKVAAGYKDVTEDEFWYRGHIPGRPLMPGVIMCEAAAQLCSFYYRKNDLANVGKFLGFGGMDKVRFRGTVIPGDRFVIVVKAIKTDSRMKIFEAQGLVNGKLVFEANISGIEV